MGVGQNFLAFRNFYSSKGFELTGCSSIKWRKVES
jgi:hypothetical protein